MRRALLLVGSPKAGASTSGSLGTYLLQRLGEHGLEGGQRRVGEVLRAPGGLDELAGAVERADLFVLSFPLYVDSLPAPVIRCLEALAARRPGPPTEGAPRFVAIVNCGFPEASQCDTALEICRRFALEAGFPWAGGLALGGGAAVDGRPLERAGGMVRNVRAALDLAGEALARGDPVPEEAVRLMARPLAPRWFYLFMGNLRWKRAARKHGTLRRLHDRPYL